MVIVITTVVVIVVIVVVAIVTIVAVTDALQNNITISAQRKSNTNSATKKIHARECETIGLVMT